MSDRRYALIGHSHDAGSGSVGWGSIVGTLSTQTDLQAALDLKAPLASPTFTGVIDVSGATFTGLDSNDLSDVASIAMLDENETVQVSWTFSARPVLSAGYELPDTSGYIWNLTGYPTWGEYWNTTTNAVEFHSAGTATITLDLDAGSIYALSDIQLGNYLGDRLGIYGTLDAATSYAIGIESSTIYYRSNGYHRWYTGTVADGGTSDRMELSSSGLVVNVAPTFNVNPTVVNTSPYYSLKDTGGTGDTVEGYFQWQNSAGGEQASIGLNATGNMYISNSGTGDIVLTTNGSTFTFDGGVGRLYIGTMNLGTQGLTVINAAASSYVELHGTAAYVDFSLDGTGATDFGGRIRYYNDYFGFDGVTAIQIDGVEWSTTDIANHDSLVTNALTASSNTTITGNWGFQHDTIGDFMFWRNGITGAAGIGFRNDDGVKGYVGFGDDERFIIWNSGAAVSFAINNTGAISTCTGATFTGAVTIDTDGAAAQLVIGDGTSTTGDVLLQFNIDRPWSFRAEGDDANSYLLLYAENAGKNFYIGSAADIDAFIFYPDGGNLTAAGTVTANKHQGTGLSTSWGTTSGVNTGAYNTVMGVSSSATWLASGTSSGTFRGGIQLLDTGGAMRLYVSSAYLEYNSSNQLKLGGSNYLNDTKIGYVDTMWGWASDASTHNFQGSTVPNASASASSIATTWSNHITQWKSGAWDINGATWMPDANWWWCGTFAHTSNTSSYNYSGQIAFQNATSPNVYMRTISGGTPGTWHKVPFVSLAQTITADWTWTGYTANMRYGISGDYTEVGGGNNFGSTIWCIDNSYKGGTAGSNSSPSGVYGLRWHRNAHTSTVNDGIGEGIYVYVAGTNYGGIGSYGMRSSGPIYIGEKANSNPDITYYGQLWVLSETDNLLMFTNDSGTDKHVGMGQYTLLANQTFDMNTAGNAEKCVNGAWYSDNATAYTLTLENSTGTDFPVGSQLTVWNEGSGTLTINEGTTTTLYLLTGSAVTDTAGGCTMAQGGYATIIRKSSTVYLIMGSGITA